MTKTFLKTSRVIFYLAILTLSVVFAFPAAYFATANGIPAPPIGRVFIQSDGTIEPSTVPIQRVGDTYTFTGNMPNSSLVVKRDNIVIDGAGYGIHGYSTHNYEAIIISYRTNITIKNLDISPFGYGVRMDYASNNTIIGNTMQVFTGVSLIYSDNNKIINNTITEGYGVQGRGSNNQIIGNTFTSGLDGGGNGMGVYIAGDKNIISQNFFRHELSIQIMALSAYNIISNNTIVDGRTGILLGKSSHNLIFGNLIKGKIDDRGGALSLSSESYNNTIYANQFENNRLAVSLGMQIADWIYNDVSGNRFYQNNFINNTQNVWIASGTPINQWDNGAQGNYWSTHQGADSNGDGISEVPYVMTANNTDRYPLMQPIDISTMIEQLPTPTPTLTPSSSPLPAQTTTPQPTSSPIETPQIPEMTTWAVPLFFTIATLFAIGFRKSGSKVQGFLSRFKAQTPARLLWKQSVFQLLFPAQAYRQQLSSSFLLHHTLRRLKSTPRWRQSAY